MEGKKEGIEFCFNERNPFDSSKLISLVPSSFQVLLYKKSLKTITWSRSHGSVAQVIALVL